MEKIDVKHLRKVDFVFIIGSLFVLIFLVGYTRPLVIAPLGDYSTTETEILFSIEKADKILIDDNFDFSTPDEYFVEDGLKISLNPGKYYWKAVGVLGSQIRTLTINSEVKLKLKETNDGYGVVNDGNLKLNVDVYDGEELVDKFGLDVGDFVEAEELKYVGESYE